LSSPIALRKCGASREHCFRVLCFFNRREVKRRANCRSANARSTTRTCCTPPLSNSIQLLVILGLDVNAQRSTSHTPSMRQDISKSKCFIRNVSGGHRHSHIMHRPETIHCTWERTCHLRVTPARLCELRAEHPAIQRLKVGRASAAAVVTEPIDLPLQHS
jgi:hypothetical protein